MPRRKEEAMRVTESLHKRRKMPPCVVRIPEWMGVIGNAREEIRDAGVGLGTFGTHASVQNSRR